MESMACPCKRTQCVRHGNCALCRAHHCDRRVLPACEREGKPSAHKPLSEMTLTELWHLFPIELTAPDPRFAADYTAMERTLRELLRDCRPRIYHIGSTAIHGIWAKPIVDVLVELPTEEQLQEGARRLVLYGCREMSRQEHRVSLNWGYTEEGFADKVYHLHLRLTGDVDEVCFRDYLNAHPAVAKAYEALKLELWKRYEFDRDGYTDAKTEFIQTYTAMAKRKMYKIYGLTEEE